MQAAKGEFVIIQYQEKTHFVKVTSVKEKVLSGKIQGRKHILDTETLKFFKEDIIANLGKKPKRGKAFGVEVEYLRKEFSHGLGYVYIFCSMKKEAREKLKKDLNKIQKTMGRFGLLSLAPFGWYIYSEPKSKMLGYYSTNKREDEYDAIAYNHGALGNNFIETVSHELGHGIWNRLIIRDSTKAKWIKSYAKYVELSKYDEKEIRKLGKMFIKSGQSCKDFLKVLKEEEDSQDQVQLFNNVLSFINKSQRLSKTELDNLIMSGNADLIEAAWPETAIYISEFKDNLISEYAKKNVREYFSECVRCYLTGQKLPKKVQKLMEKTFQEVASNKQREVEDG